MDHLLLQSHRVPGWRCSRVRSERYADAGVRFVPLDGDSRSWPLRSSPLAHRARADRRSSASHGEPAQPDSVGPIPGRGIDCSRQRRHPFGRRRRRRGPGSRALGAAGRRASCRPDGAGPGSLASSPSTLTPTPPAGGIASDATCRRRHTLTVCARSQRKGRECSQRALRTSPRLASSADLGSRDDARRDDLIPFSVPALTRPTRLATVQVRAMNHPGAGSRDASPSRRGHLTAVGDHRPRTAFVLSAARALPRPRSGCYRPCMSARSARLPRQTSAGALTRRSSRPGRNPPRRLGACADLGDLWPEDVFPGEHERPHRRSLRTTRPSGPDRGLRALCAVDTSSSRTSPGPSRFMSSRSI